jgi:pimeloyl-ACP methyl ester carboxylesterase
LVRPAVQAEDARTNAAQLAGGFRLPMPVLAIGGTNSYPHARGRGKETEESLRRVATDVRGAVIDECGHFVPEEQPAVFNRMVSEFFAEPSS